MRASAAKGRILGVHQYQKHWTLVRRPRSDMKALAELKSSPTKWSWLIPEPPRLARTRARERASDVHLESTLRSSCVSLRRRSVDISGYSQAKLNAIARQLNERPRRTLGYRTPAEMFSQTVASTG